MSGVVARRRDVKLLRDQGEVLIDGRRVSRARMDDEQADHADGFLHGVVGVVEIGAGLMHGHFVHPRAAGLDRVLSQEGDAVHRDGQFQAVQVQFGRLREFVVQHDAHPVALGDLDGGSGHGAVVAPVVHEGVGQQLALDGLGVEVEFLGPVDHLPRQVVGKVRRLDEHGRLGGGTEPGTSLPRSVGLPSGPPGPACSRG